LTLVPHGCASPTKKELDLAVEPVEQARGELIEDKLNTCIYADGNGPVLYSCPGTMRMMTEEEIEAARQEVALLDDGTEYAAEPVREDDREELVAMSIARPGEPISVTVALPEPGFDWEWFHNQMRESGAQERTIAVRQRQIDAVFADVVTDLNNLGIYNIRRFWIVPFIGIDVTSPKAARSMALWPVDRKVWINREYRAVPNDN